MAHGEGTTTSQMTSSPKRSVFVWVNSQLDYPRRLAKKLNREDLEIVSPNWLSNDQWIGRTFPAIVLDHACYLTREQWLSWNRALANVRPSPVVVIASR